MWGEAIKCLVAALKTPQMDWKQGTKNVARPCKRKNGDTSNAKIVDAPVIPIDKRVRVNYNGEGLYFDANIRGHSEKGYLVEYIDYSGEHDRYEDGVPPERIIGK